MSKKLLLIVLIAALGVCLATAQSDESGSFLVGEFEGPTIITDAGMMPSMYSESPMLSAMVEAGDLPPVEERLPANPGVIQPAHEIGQYGGQWRRGYTGPGDVWNARRIAGNDNLLFMDYTLNEIKPWVFESWEANDDFTQFTFGLREGHKWSDGAPFTADDIVFWFEELFLNEEFLPAPSTFLSVNGEFATLTKIDDLTVQYSFSAPYPLFLKVMATPSSNIASHARRGWNGHGGYAPAHYIKQFHPDFADEAELNAILEEGGYSNWVDLVKSKNDWARNPDLPTLAPWRVKLAPADNPVYVLERNPYYFNVDAEGNQLPYIDSIVLTLAEDLEVLNLRAIAGEYDLQSRHIDLQKLPLYIENAERGDYSIRLDPSDYGANVLLFFGQTYSADAEIAGWLQNVDFRRAVSMGVDGEQVNETFLLGLGVARSVVPTAANPYYPGEEYETLYTAFDADAANQLLDDIGLSAKDGDGYRLRADNGERLTLTLTTPGASFVPYPKIAEMVANQLGGIGLHVIPEQLERSLWQSRIDNGEIQLSLWDNGGTEDVFLHFNNTWLWARPNYTDWMRSGGAIGDEPPAEIKEAMEIWVSGPALPPDERIEAGKRLWVLFAENVWQAGIVGSSPAVLGTRVVKNAMGNVPARQLSNVLCMTPGCTLPETYFIQR